MLDNSGSCVGCGPRWRVLFSIVLKCVLVFLLVVSTVRSALAGKKSKVRVTCTAVAKILLNYAQVRISRHCLPPITTAP